MLSFYHIRAARALCGHEDCEGAQRLEIDVGGLRQRPRPAGLRVAHPAGDLQARETRPLDGCTPHDPEPVPASACLNLDLLSVPRMPSVAYLQDVGIVGVRSLGCTTGAGLTRRWPAGPRIWFTTACILSARLRNVPRAECHLPRPDSCPTPWGHHLTRRCQPQTPRLSNTEAEIAGRGILVGQLARWFAPLGWRGSGPRMEQWLTSPAGRQWNVIGTGSGTSGLRPPSPFKRGESRTGSGGSC